MPPKSQSLCLPPLAFLFIEVNLSLFNNNKKDWCSKGNTEIARIIFTLWIEGIQFSSSDCKITKAAVEQRKLPRFPVRLLPAAPPLDFMILFYYEANLKAQTEKGLATVDSFPLINVAPYSMRFWEVPYEEYHSIITVHSSCLVSTAGFGNQTRIRF